MLRILKNRNAQAMMGEYVVIFALVMAVLMMMTMYFKRAVQARIHDARDYMVGQVRVRTAGVFNGDLYKEYEPYYVNTIANVARTADIETRLDSGGSSGIFEKIYDETSTVRSESQTLPPKEYERTTPVN